MRNRLIIFLKQHPSITDTVWKLSKLLMFVVGLFVPVKKNSIIFCSFGGRKFDDSPKAIYEEVCRRKEFDGWELTWAFVDPSEFNIPRGRKVRIDTPSFFYALLKSHVWVSNSGMDRGIELHRRRNIIVETWHGSPIKKTGGDENQNSMLKKPLVQPRTDKRTIRCAQSKYDRDIYARLFHAKKQCFLMSDLPRNDSLLTYTDEELRMIKKTLGIKDGKKVILYMPTYREYLINENKDIYIAPPIDINKWRRELGEDFVLLIRAHYAVSAALNIQENDYIKDVSQYRMLNDLYAVADTMISDYSSSFFDYSILERPMFCFAYDYEEYNEKRGLYVDLNKFLPCRVNHTEEELLDDIKTFDYEQAVNNTRAFHKKYTPYAGHASKSVVDEILKRL